MPAVMAPAAFLVELSRRGVSVRDEAGNLRGFAKVLQDVTERQRMERVLRVRAEALTGMLNALTQKPDLESFLGSVQ